MRKKFLFYFLITCFLIGFSSCTVVDATHEGIKFRKWAANADAQGTLASSVTGIVWYNPFTTSVYQFPTYIQRISFDDITVNTNDGAIFRISPNLAYQIDRERAIDIFLTYRRPLNEIEQGFILTAVFDAYRTVGNTFTSDEIMSRRGDFEGQVRTMLGYSLASEGFIVRDFTAQIMPPQSLIASIDARNQMVQEALRAENEVQRTRAQAEIRITEARGRAEAMRIDADAKAYYNRTVSASLTPLLIQQQAVETWNGVVPTVSGSGALPLINLPAGR